MVSSEEVAQALFDLGCTANADDTPLVTTSRRFVHFNAVGAEMMPAFYQFQAPARVVAMGARGLPVHRMNFYWIIYLRKSEGPDDPVSPLLNQYYDALSNALLGPLAGEKQTLGGKVISCYQEGSALIDEGLLDTPSLIVIPITVLIGI